MINSIVELHQKVFDVVERLARGWFLGLAARFVFFATLYFYFINSWQTKVEPGLLGIFSIRNSAYYQIVPWSAGSEDIGLFDHLMVFAGTWSEVLLPSLIVIGLFSRIAAFGMICFVLVQSYVDIAFHGVDAETAGTWFDRDSGSLIYDQRAFWVFLLLVIVIKGAGAISVDRILSGMFRRG